jgi:hypothetical protein
MTKTTNYLMWLTQMSVTVMVTQRVLTFHLTMTMTKACHSRNLRYVFLDVKVRIVTQCCMQNVKKGKNTCTKLWDQVMAKQSKGQKGSCDCRQVRCSKLEHIA